MPTEIGKLVFGYADEIFGSVANCWMRWKPAEQRPLRLVVGIDDVVPKETAHRLIEPALAWNMRCASSAAKARSSG